MRSSTELVFAAIVCMLATDLCHATELELVVIAESDRQWTGIGVSSDGRIFANYPRWSANVPVSVVELTSSGELPFPNVEWNRWSPSVSPEDHFVAVQSVYVDDEDFLWVLDTGNPRFQGVVKDGPKLVKYDLASNQAIQTIAFDSSVALNNSYLNDVRVDTSSGYAYLSDSNNGALIVVNLDTGQSRRVLDDHPSTQAENIRLTIEGRSFSSKVDVDGIALDSAEGYLYYQALRGRSLYRIETRWLQDETLNDRELGQKVEFLAETGAADGLAFGKEDGKVYLTSIEHNAIRRYEPGGDIEMVMQDDQIKWPDSVAITDRGIFFTTSQIHLGSSRLEPYRVYQIRPIPEPCALSLLGSAAAMLFASLAMRRGSRRFRIGKVQ